MDQSEHAASVSKADIETALAEPAIASLLSSHAPVVVAALDPLTIVFANSAAETFFGAPGHAALSARLFASPDLGSKRLVELARILRADAPPRLEKLRFAIGRRMETLTCLCRRVGEARSLIVIGAMGVRVAAPPAPAAPKLATVEPPAAAPVQSDPPPSPPAEIAIDPPPAMAVGNRDFADAERAILARFGHSPSVRFLWKSDAQARLVEITGQLCEAVGCDSAALIGQNFPDQARLAGADPEGRLAAQLNRRETWSGLQLLWPIGGADAAAPITLGALPSFDRSREFDGFRGFGVIHIQRLEPFVRPLPAPEDAIAATAEALAPAVHSADEDASHDLDADIEEAAEFAVPEAARHTLASQTDILDQAPAPEPDEPNPEAPATPPVAREPAPGHNVVPLWAYRVQAVPFTQPPAIGEPTAPAAPPPPVEPAAIGEPPPAPAGDSARSRLVELTPAERKAFSEIARALGAAPVDDDERQRKALAAEDKHAALEKVRLEAENAAAALEMDVDNEPVAEGFDPELLDEEGDEESAEAPTVAGIIGAVATQGAAPEETASGEPAPPVAGSSDADDDPLDHEEPSAHAATPPIGLAFHDVTDLSAPVTTPDEPPVAHHEEPEAAIAEPAPAPVDIPSEPMPLADARNLGEVARNAAAVLDRLPVGVLVSRMETPIYLNRALLELLGFASADLFHEAGGLERMFHGRQPEDLTAAANGGTIPIVSASGDVIPVEGRLRAIDWDGEPATLMSFRKPGDSDLLPHVRSLEAELRQAEAQTRELHAVLDTATDGVAVLDQNGRILSLNRSAEALFGFEQNEVAGEPFTILLAPESHVAASEYLAGLRANGVASLLNDGRDVVGRARQGGSIQLFMTLGRLGANGQKFCAVLRDMTQWKKVERDLRDARREAERASQLKSDFLAKISHEIRTPLNAIIGFAEVIMEERFGPVGNERYKDYLKDIHASGGHVMSLVNDLLDLSKIEAGKLDLNFGAVDANKIISECVSLIQPQATTERVIVRTSLAPRLPKIVADERSLRQIVLNLLSNAVKFNEPGGQVIVSTALTDSGHAVLRIKDTGIGMSEAEVQTALEPFRQIQTSRAHGGTGLGLPLTKALVEANRASFTIRSKKAEGTLVEVSFPSTRVLAE